VISGRKNSSWPFTIILLIGLIVLPNFAARADGDKGGGVLDGKVFLGTIGQSSDAQYQDKLQFNNGMFWSEICTRCGFQPGKYWTRTSEGETHFRGEMTGGYGTFVYSGKIINGKAVVDVFWEKKRWYWTSSRKLSFDGSLKSAEISVPANQASKKASDALMSKLPAHCW
jgi:hypothetical protein